MCCTMLQTWYGVIQIVSLDMVTFQWYLLMEKKGSLQIAYDVCNL